MAVRATCARAASSASSAASHSVGFVLTRAADFSVKSAQAPRSYRQALIKTIWRRSDRLVVIERQAHHGVVAGIERRRRVATKTHGLR